MDGYTSLSSNELYIFNDNMTLINNTLEDSKKYCSFSSKDSMMIHASASAILPKENIWYSNYFSYKNEGTKYSFVKIEGNTIYYLYSKVDTNSSNNNYGTIEERKYTIDSNKLKYEVINTYKAIDVVGQIC